MKKQVRARRHGVLLIYRDHGGDWRWRLKAGNGKIVADSSEAYSSKTKAERAATELARHVGTAVLKMRY